MRTYNILSSVISPLPTPPPQINGVNGTLIANQYVRDDPSEQNAPIRTLISLDNGGFWQLVQCIILLYSPSIL